MLAWNELQILEVDTLSFCNFVHSLESLVEAVTAKELRLCDDFFRSFATKEDTG